MALLKEDLEVKKKKLFNVQKIENSLEYYKSKYEESLRIAERKSELEKINELYINKLEDFEKKIGFLNTKISKYKEKISIEKNKLINLEIEQSKKSIEIEGLKAEILESNKQIERLEGEIEDRNSQIEKLNIEMHIKELHVNEAPSLGNELNEMIMNMEAHHNLMKMERKASLKNAQIPQAKEMSSPEIMVLSLEKKNQQAANIEESQNVQKELNEEQIELLEKENSLLIEKLKELQKENERMRIELQKVNASNQNSLAALAKEKEQMKEEINKLKIISPNLANKEVLVENKMLREELESLKSVG